jgi:nucleoside-diphosphate-sugar epimerase
MALLNHVDVEWMASEAASMGGSGIPKHPLIVGGSGLVGSNLFVLLAKIPGCEKVKILDIVPPNPLILADAKIEVDFVKHDLGVDSMDLLSETLNGVDCVFTTVTPHVQDAVEADFYSCNDRGMKTLIEACKAKKIPRLVHLSSIAATNHFVESFNQSEADGLPDFALYTSPYDISKRRGEEAVLAAHDDAVMRTCSLRAGGVLLSPTDFSFRNLFLVDGIIANPIGMRPIDFIDGRDLARALVLAAKGLEQKPAEVGGQVFFTTKGGAMCGGDIADIAVKALGWWNLPVPNALVWIAWFFAGLLYHIKRLFCLRVSGVPPHWFMRKGFIQKTFDNTKAKNVLGYEPKVGMEECVIRICKLYLKAKAEKKNAKSK